MNPGLTAHALLEVHAAYVAGVIPNPAPIAPVGSDAISSMIGWIKWGALACCFVSALLAGGMIPLGNTSRRGELAERGKTTLICAVIGSVIVAIACSLITSSYGLG
jgi:hypothetical protein